MQIKFGELVRVPHTGKKSPQHVDAEFKKYVAQKVANHPTGYQFGIFTPGQQKARWMFADGEDFKNIAADIIFRCKTHQETDKQALADLSNVSMPLHQATVAEALVVKEYVDKATVLDFEA